MSARFATRFVPALLLSAMAWATPAAAQGFYDSEYDHYQRDRREAQQHRREDRLESFGHVIGDLFRYGTTDPYSSPEHYYRDRRRVEEHYLRDQDRAWDHYRRDRWDDYHRDRWDSHRRGGYSRNDDYYYRNDDYRSRDRRDR